MSKLKVITIVGPTASGKTSLSIDLAKKFNGEVISADSRQVYRGLDIGSGKVTETEMGDVPHHLLDVCDPMNIYNASDFKIAGTAAIIDITSRDQLPIIAGGTFFYVDTLLGRITTPEVPPNPELRIRLEEMNIESLFKLLEERDEERALSVDRHNKPRLIRALEIVEAIGKVPKFTPSESIYDTFTIGIKIDRDILHNNIHIRLLERLDEGMVAEVEKLIANGVTHERLENLGLEYRYISRYLRDVLTYEEMVSELETKIKQFAKRQMTWLKRDETIHWMNPKEREPIFKLVEEFLTE